MMDEKERQAALALFCAHGENAFSPQNWVCLYANVAGHQG